MESLNRMGVHVSQKNSVLTYQEFSNFTKAFKTRKQWLKENKKTKRLKLDVDEDPIANTCILIDEAHKIVALNTDVARREEYGDVVAMQKLIWNSL